MKLFFGAVPSHLSSEERGKALARSLTIRIFEGNFAGI